jgi:hypothetical protein
MSEGKGPNDRSAKRAARRMLPITAVLAVVVFALAFGGEVVVAQDQAPSAPSQPSAGAQTQNLAPPESIDDPPAQDAPTPPPHPRASRSRASRSTLSEHLSSDLSQYLHQHHLPFVDAMVFSNADGRPTSVKLSGQVRTEHGKEDAETKSSDFLNEPGLSVQNHIEVDASLASTAPASSSASAESPPGAPAPVAAADPCTDLCLKDEGHCNTACQTQAAGSASSGGLAGILGGLGRSATQLQQCNDQCVQTREHCKYDCGQSASSAPSSQAADSGSAPPSASDHRAEGPDIPPE